MIPADAFFLLDLSFQISYESKMTVWKEIEQPTENVAAYKDYQPYKIVLIETCGDNQRDKKGNQADGNADESQNDVFVLYRWFHIVFFGYYL